MTGPAPFVWMHSDRRGGPQATAQAIARAKARAWDSDAFAGSAGTRAADLRALAASSCYLYARLADPVFITEREGTTWLPDLDSLAFATPERAAAALALMNTWNVLSAGLPPPESTLGTAEGATEAGAWPAIAIGIAATAIALAVFAVAARPAEVIDRHLRRKTEAEDRESQRRERMRALIETHAIALEVIDRHQQREKEAGQTLPLDAASAAVLGQLRHTQDALAATEPPMPPEPPLAPGGWNAAFPWLAAVAGLGLTLFLFKDDK